MVQKIFKNNIDIIITGGCGFIGSNLIKKLIKKSNKILNIDSLNCKLMRLQ